MTTKLRWGIVFVALPMMFAVVEPSSAAPLGDPIGVGRLATTIGSLAAGPNTLIDFNELTRGPGNPSFGEFESKGYAFQSEHAHVMRKSKGCAFGGCVGDSSIFISEEAGSPGRPVTMARAHGAKFCLKQFDGAEDFLDDDAAREGGYPNATAILVVGTKVSGAQVTETFMLDDVKDGNGGVTDFQQFTLSQKFRGLVSVTFYGNDRRNSGAMSFDNISVRS